MMILLWLTWVKSLLRMFDDVYLVFADKKMSIEEFAQETYLSTDEMNL